MPTERIELSTSGLQDHCSTTELSRLQNLYKYPGGNYYREFKT